jgi:hypothetical protein
MENMETNNDKRIFVILEVVEQETQEGSFTEEVPIGYAVGEEEAKRACNTDRLKALYQKNQDKYNEWINKRNEWRQNNGHRYIDPFQAKSREAKYFSLKRKLDALTPPDLTNVPEGRRDRVMSDYNDKRFRLTQELSEIEKKGKLSLAEVQYHNDSLDREMNAAIGDHPKYMEAPNERSYKELPRLQYPLLEAKNE